MAAALDVRVIDADTSRELRRSVLRPDWPVGSALPGDDEPGVVHLGAFVDGELRSTCLVFPQPCPWLSTTGTEPLPPAGAAWRLRSMATDPAARHRGGGSAVLDAAMAKVRAAGGAVLWCFAREGALGFYREHGFAAAGEPFDDHGIAHVPMWRHL